MKWLTVIMCLLVIGCYSPHYTVVEDAYKTYAPVYNEPKPLPQKTIKRTVKRTYQYIPLSQVPKGAVIK
jgi:hypothetical protein